MKAHTPRFGIVGWKNSGKTTMTAQLVAELTRRGLTISTVKRAHDGFDIDHPGTDSHAHRQAGARDVAIVSTTRWALIHENGRDEPAPSLDAIIARLTPCDIVLVEGFKRAGHPKIEMRLAAEPDRPLLSDADPSVVAHVIDDTGGVHRGRLPVFARDDIAAVADLVLSTCAISPPMERQGAG